MDEKERGTGRVFELAQQRNLASVPMCEFQLSSSEGSYLSDSEIHYVVIISPRSHFPLVF
jgi:hypothetical protein